MSLIGYQRHESIEDHANDVRALTALLVAVTSALSHDSNDEIPVESYAVSVHGSGVEWLDAGVRLIANTIEEHCSRIVSLDAESAETSLDVEQAARYLRFKNANTFLAMAVAVPDGIPHKRHNDRLYFAIGDLDRWLAGQKERAR